MPARKSPPCGVWVIDWNGRDEVVARRLLATYLTITTLALAAIVVPLGITFASRERDRLMFDIERDAQAVAALVEDSLEAGVAPDIDEVLHDYRATGGRVVVVDTGGIGLADSDSIGAEPRDFSTRPEIAGALDGRRVSGTRRSETLGTNLVFVAIPVASGGAVHGAVRITFPTSTLDARVRNSWLGLVALSVAVLAVVAAVGVALAGGVTRPVRRLQKAAAALAAGDLATRVEGGGVPELADLAQTFNSTAQRLEALIGSQNRFVADASHQLRSPLTALRLRLETLESVVPDEARPRLDAAVAETARLGRLVQSLLVLARSDATVPECTEVELAPVIDDRGEAWTPAAADVDARLAIDRPEGIIVRATSGAVEQILDNLISNALNFAPAGSTVTVQVDARASTVDIHVIDEGPGMDPEARRDAFERFWRPESSTGEGFGLGLAIVRQLVGNCGGTARLEPGAGGRGIDAVVELERFASHSATNNSYRALTST